MLLSPCPPSQPRKPFTALVLLRCEQPAVVFRFPLNKQVGILTSSLEDTPPLCKPTRGGSLPALLAACLEKKKSNSQREVWSCCCCSRDPIQPLPASGGIGLGLRCEGSTFIGLNGLCLIKGEGMCVAWELFGHFTWLPVSKEPFKTQPELWEEVQPSLKARAVQLQGTYSSKFEAYQ